MEEVKEKLPPGFDMKALYKPYGKFTSTFGMTMLRRIQAFRWVVRAFTTQNINDIVFCESRLIAQCDGVCEGKGAPPVHNRPYGGRILAGDFGTKRTPPVELQLVFIQYSAQAPFTSRQIGEADPFRLDEDEEKRKFGWKGLRKTGEVNHTSVTQISSGLCRQQRPVRRRIPHLNVEGWRSCHWKTSEHLPETYARSRGRFREIRRW